MVKQNTRYGDLLLLRVFDAELPEAEHGAAVSQAFFAPSNDASAWFDGWHGAVAAAQGAATVAQAVEHWWGAADKDVLVVRPEEDVMAVPENAVRLGSGLDDRASLAMVPNTATHCCPNNRTRWLRRSCTGSNVGNGCSNQSLAQGLKHWLTRMLDQERPNQEAELTEAP